MKLSSVIKRKIIFDHLAKWVALVRIYIYLCVCGYKCFIVSIEVIKWLKNMKIKRITFNTHGLTRAMQSNINGYNENDNEKQKEEEGRNGGKVA